MRVPVPGYGWCSAARNRLPARCLTGSRPPGPPTSPICTGRLRRPSPRPDIRCQWLGSAPCQCPSGGPCRTRRCTSSIPSCSRCRTVSPARSPSAVPDSRLAITTGQRLPRAASCPTRSIALEGVPGVREAAVVALDAGTEHARLAAAVTFSVPSGEGEPSTVAALRAALAAELPEYLVPDLFAFLEDLPRTPSGKVDRRELTRQLTELQDTSHAGQAEYTAPRTELERAVAEAFTQVLRIKAVDVHTDFFAAGGNSLLLARLASLLGSRHDVEIPLHDFFRTPTAAGVAETIEVYRRAGIEGVLSRQHAATLEADGRLDESVSPQGLPEAEWADPRRILLTGATGYLGLHLLEQLLRRTDADVLCLCRAPDAERALQRIKEGLAHYEIDVSDYLHRVRCVVGDLAEPYLGLTKER